MALSGNFFGAMQCVLPGEKTPNTTFAAPVRLRLVSKIHKKLIEFFHKSVILTVVAKMGENHFLRIPAGENWFDRLTSLVCLNNPNPAQLSWFMAASL